MVDVSITELVVWGSSYVVLISILPRVVSPIRTSWIDVVLGLHNSLLALLSLSMLVGVLWTAASAAIATSLFDVFCDAAGTHSRGPIYTWLYIFYLSKIIEFLDTVFLILRGRPVTFLHWFHHLMTFLICWIGLNSQTTYSWIAMASNSLVHLFMYTYFAWDAFTGKKFWWAKYLTQMQMLQFLVNLGAMGLWAMFRLSGVRCSGDWTGLVVCGAAMIIYFYLFSRLFQQKYKKQQK